MKMYKKRLTIDASLPLDSQHSLSFTSSPFSSTQQHVPPQKSALRPFSSRLGASSNDSLSSLASSNSGIISSHSHFPLPPPRHPGQSSSPDSSPDHALLTPPQSDYIPSSSNYSSLLRLGTGGGESKLETDGTARGGGRGARGGGLALPLDQFPSRSSSKSSSSTEQIAEGRIAVDLGLAGVEPEREEDCAAFSTLRHLPRTQTPQKLLQTNFKPPSNDPFVVEAPQKRSSSLFGRGKSSTGGGRGLFSKSRPSNLSKPAEWEEQEVQPPSESGFSSATVPSRGTLKSSTPSVVLRPRDHPNTDVVPFSPFVVASSNTSTGLSSYTSPSTEYTPSSKVQPSATSTLATTSSASSLSFPLTRQRTACSTSTISTSSSRSPTSLMLSPLPKYPASRQTFNTWIVLTATVHKKPQPSPAGPKGSSSHQQHPSLFGSKKKTAADPPWKKRTLVFTVWKEKVPSPSVGGKPTTRGGAALHLFKDDWKSAVEEGRMPLVPGAGVRVLDATSGAGSKELVVGVGFEESQEGGGKKAGVRSKNERELGWEKEWVVQFADERTMRTWVEEMRAALVIPSSLATPLNPQSSTAVDSHVVAPDAFELSQNITTGSTEAVAATSPLPSASGTFFVGAPSNIESSSLQTRTSTSSAGPERERQLSSSTQLLSLVDSTLLQEPTTSQTASSRSITSLTGLSYAYTFDPERFPLPDYPTLRAALLPIAVLATHVQKKSQAATIQQGQHPQSSITSMFGKGRGDANSSWKERVLVLTSFVGSLEDLSGLDDTERSTFGCLHLFKGEGPSGVEIGRMPLSQRVSVSLVDPLSPDGVSAGEGRKHILSITVVGGEKEDWKQRTMGDDGVRGKHEKELGPDKRWIVEMADEITMREWVAEIKSILLIQRAGLMGLGDAAREQKRSGLAFDGDLDIALAQLASRSRAAASSASATPLTPFSRGFPTAELARIAESATPPSSQPTPPPPPPNEPTVPPSVASMSDFSARSIPPPDRTSSRPTKTPTSRSSSSSSFASRFGRESLPIITSPILVASTNPRVSHLTKRESSGGSPRHLDDPAFQRLEAFLKNEEKTQRLRLKAEITREPSPMESEFEEKVEPEEVLSVEDCHPHATRPPIPSFRSSDTKPSHKRASSASTDSQSYAESIPFGSEETSSPATTSSYFSQPGYLNDFTLERKPSASSANSSQRTSSTGRSKDRSSLPMRPPPPIGDLPPTPLESSDDPNTQRLIDENKRLRDELALLSENARLKAELERFRSGQHAPSDQHLSAISRSSSTSGRLSPSSASSPTSSSFSTEVSFRRGAVSRGPPSYPPPSSLPPSIPSFQDGQGRAGPHSPRRRGSDPPQSHLSCQLPPSGRRPSLPLQTLPEFTVSPPPHNQLPPGYRSVSSSSRILPPAPALPTSPLPPVPTQIVE